MMAGRVQGKELVVESMRQPSQGMPIKSVGRGKGPPDGAPGQTTLDVEIAGDVIAIVEDDKRVPNDGAVEGYGHGCEQKAEDGLQLGAGEEWPASRRCFGVQLSPAGSACFRETLGAAHLFMPIVHSPRKLLVFFHRHFISTPINPIFPLTSPSPITFLNHVPQSQTKRLFALISEFASSNVQELALSMLRSIPPKIISA
jgi:hypothetical protein